MRGLPLETRSIGWRWWLAIALFLSALIGLMAGVSLTERPGVPESNLLTKAYYSLGLFVVGGMDLGTPTGGPWFARVLLWIAYFGAPLLTASAVVDAVLTAMAQRRWHLQRIKHHIVIAGSGDLTTSYLRVLRARDRTTPVVVVDTHIDPVRETELRETFGVTTVIGDITHEFLLNELQLGRARRMVMLLDSDFVAYEAASIALRLFPNLQGRLLIHCNSLRFLRSMENSRVSRQSVRFNAYNLAAQALVRDQLLAHFTKTEGDDTVILAGFGLFGQTVLEELQQGAMEQISEVLLIDIDAHRRLQVAEEQGNVEETYRKWVLQGDIAHPDVWRQVAEEVDLAVGEPVIILGTGRAEDNLRTSLWLKQKYPGALVFARTNDASEFAMEIAAEHDVHCLSMTQLVEENIPESWLG